MLQRYGYGSGRIRNFLGLVGSQRRIIDTTSHWENVVFSCDFFPVLQRVDVETVDSLGRMVEDVVGAAVDSLPEEDTALIQQIIQAARAHTYKLLRFFPDPVPAFQVNSDLDTDPGF